jgi:hypothetical protein
LNFFEAIGITSEVNGPCVKHARPVDACSRFLLVIKCLLQWCLFCSFASSLMRVWRFIIICYIVWFSYVQTSGFPLKLNGLNAAKLSRSNNSWLQIFHCECIRQSSKCDYGIWYDPWSEVSDNLNSNDCHKNSSVGDSTYRPYGSL